MAPPTEGADETVTIREIRPDDADVVTQLTVQLGYMRSTAEIRRWIMELGSSQRGQAAFVACLGAEVIGWVEVSLQHRVQSRDFALIGGLVVGQEHRRRGVGRCLCERAEQWSWAQGAARLRVTSRSTRMDAHRFYLREGFELVKTSAVFEKKQP